SGATTTAALPRGRCPCPEALFILMRPRETPLFVSSSKRPACGCPPPRWCPSASWPAEAVTLVTPRSGGCAAMSTPPASPGLLSMTPLGAWSSEALTPRPRSSCPLSGGHRWPSTTMRSSHGPLRCSPLGGDPLLRELVRRTFVLDVFACGRCGGRLKGVGVREGGGRSESDSGAPGPAHGRCEAGPGARLMSSTSTTSTRGVTLISLFTPPRPTKELHDTAPIS